MLMDGLRPALFGLGLGLLMSFAATRIFQSMLFGTKPLDPVVLSGVIATLLAVAVLACLVRELALPYILAMGAFAIWERRWREAAAWAIRRIEERS